MSTWQGAFTLARTAPSPAEYMFRGTLTRDNFGIHYVRWPYDPALSVGGAFTSANPSRYKTELGSAIGWMRTFDPNIFGRYQGGAFVKVGDSAEGTSHPYGRMEGGAWYQGMLRSDGTYDFSKLDVVLAAAEAQNLKVVMTIGAQGAYWDGTNYIEYCLPTGEFASLDWAGYQARVLAFLGALFDHAGGRIAAIELANEPGKLVRLNTVVGVGHTEQLAVLCRLAKQAIRSRGLSTLVLSPPFQGGETGEITAFLTASAAGISTYGSDGTGTLGRDWIDVIAHHNYGNFSDRAAGGSTTAMDAAAVNDTAADAAYPNNTSFADMLAKARAVRSAAAVGGFSGPMWNTEFNVTGSVSTGAWYPRKMTQAGMARIYQQALVASFAGGYDKCFLYAADHPTLGLYDDTGTPPGGEPADWYFKAPDNTARGATALAQAIAAMTGGELVLGTTGSSANPFVTVSAAQLKVSSSASGGVFA
ncbi:MAG: hypothetical protein SHS37scaffold296_1 [Burkholderiales phage 68_11]|jgi:hypothetical protein|nr:MAG: hypothetical protein SHS37scaffold296_1 [Burkholderiales phage 68_11]